MISENKYDTIIVGAGMAGLTAAAFLSKQGRNVLLIEKNKECGGLVNSFTHNGFTFDAGVRALLDAGIIAPLLKELNINMDVVKSHVSVGLGNDIIDVKSINSLKTYRELLEKHYSNSREDITKVMKVIKRIMKHMNVLYGVQNPVMIDLMREKKFLFTVLLPWLPKFLLTLPKINRMNMPVEAYLETLVDNPSLRDILSQHFFKNTPTFFALSYFSLYLNYFYPKEGVGTLATKLENRVEEFGGEIKRETTIKSVNASEKMLTDMRGVTYSYCNLIWASDLKTFYRITRTEGLSNKIRAKFDREKDKMMARRGGDSVFTLYLEVDEPLDRFKEISNGHFFYTPTKEGLGEIHRGELEKLLSEWDKHSKGDVKMWIDKFTRLNTYEISIPGLKNTALVPQGKTGLIISFLTEYDLFRKVKASGWYDEFIGEMESQIINVLTGSVYPFMKDKIIAQFSFTPLSIESRVGTSEGAITGWSFREPVPVIHQMQKSGRSVITPIPSIFQAGQWTYSPAGVPMAILTGKLAADRAMK